MQLKLSEGNHPSAVGVGLNLQDLGQEICQLLLAFVGFCQLLLAIVNFSQQFCHE